MTLRIFFGSYHEKEPDQEEKEQNEAYFLYNLYTKESDKKAIDRLERLVQSASSEESKMSALVWLSFCYSNSNDHEKQINLWNTALQDIKGSHHKTQCIEHLSYALKADGRSQEGLSLLENRLQQVSSDEEKIAIYKAIAAMEKDLENGLMNALSMEKVVELKPDDKENLFGAAYAQSQAEMRSLSICNYRTLLKLESNNSMAINNLGVCAAEYDLYTKAVEYYSEARNKGNTLAMANLGYKFLDAGFYQDAEEIAKEALKNESPHKNVYSLLSRIDEIKNNHSDKWSSLQKKARSFQKNIRKYVEAYYSSLGTQNQFLGRWFTEHGIEVDVSLSGQMIKAEWVEKSGALALNEYGISLSGMAKNASASVRYIKKRTNSKPSTLLGLSDSKKDVSCLSYIETENSSWFIFSKNMDDEFHLTLYRKPPNKANAADS